MGKFYRFLTILAGPFLPIFLRWRMLRGKENPARLPERMGIAAQPRPAGRLAWLHAASVGEAQSALILIDALRARYSDLSVLVTTGTVTSAELMEKRLPEGAFHQFYPLDRPVWVKRFLDHWKPDIALWMESELWPNMLAGLQTRGIPAALINARLSEKSFRNWRRIPSMAQDILKTFPVILAQTENDAQRFRNLGTDESRIRVTGNLKYAAAPLPCDESSLAALQEAIAKRPVWVYASTHAGEEALACRVHEDLEEDIPGLLTILVPRHPDRGPEILGMCRIMGLPASLRSVSYALPGKKDSVYIADTLGELGLFYTLSPVAVIGRSFSHDGGGGHNPIEAAQLDCAVLTGPHVQFQKAVFDAMIQSDAAIQVQTEEELRNSLLELLRNPARCTELQTAAQTFAQERTDVLDRVLTALEPLLSPTKKAL